MATAGGRAGIRLDPDRGSLPEVRHFTTERNPISGGHLGVGGGGAIHTANGKDISNKTPCGTARGGGSGVAGARVENAAPPVLVRPAAPIWWSGVRPRDRASISVTLSGTGHIPVRVARVYRGGVTGGRGGGL